MKWFLGVALIILLSSCTNDVIKCDAPYMLKGSECCLDKNSNKICDSDEGVSCNKPYLLVGSSCCLDANNNGVCDSDEKVSNEVKDEDKELDVEISTDAMPSIMSGLYNQYPNFGSFINYSITNNEEFPITLDISSEIQDYTSVSKDRIQVPAHSTILFNQTPLLKPSISISEITNANVQYRFSYQDKVIREATIPVKVYAKDTIVWTMEENGKLFDTSFFVAAWVTPHIPEIDEILRLAAERHPDGIIAGYQCSNCESDADFQEYADLQVKAIFETLQNDYKITYVNTPTSFSSERESSQRIKLPEDSLRSASANCIDGTVLFASILESVGIKPAIAITSNHAFVCWDTTNGENKWDCLETTMIGSSTFIEAETKGVDEFNKELDHFKEGSSKFYPLSILRKVGIKPME